MTMATARENLGDVNIWRVHGNCTVHPLTETTGLQDLGRLQELHTRPQQSPIVHGSLANANGVHRAASSTVSVLHQGTRRFATGFTQLLLMVASKSLRRNADTESRLSAD